MQNQSFTPCGATSTLTVAATSSQVTLPATCVSVTQMQIANSGTAIAFIRWGVGPQTALTTDLPILAGTVILVNKGLADTVACIGTSGTIYLTCGEGR